METINRKGLSYSELDFRVHQPGALKRTPEHPVLAIDTETYKGTARLLTDNTGAYLLNPDIMAVLEFMTAKRFNGASVFAYNLRFDAQALLKLLPRANILEVVRSKKTTYKGYTIKYLPKKLLTIANKSRHGCIVYDLAQYFETSLKKAAETHLDVRKKDFEHTAALNTDLATWEQYESEIIEYCKQDSFVTARLGEYLRDKFKGLFHENPQSWVSKGNLGKFLLRQRCYIPNFHDIPEGAQAFSLYAYKGGRFEAVKKGVFQEAELYDIVSAYPWEIMNLIDVTVGQWKFVKDYNPEAYYGFYICRVYVPEQTLAPCAYVLKQGGIIYPFGSFSTYLTKQEIEAYKDYAHIEVITGWEYYPDRIIKPFEEHILKLFGLKKSLPKSDYAYDLAKKMMNSIYGSFYEKILRDGRLKAGVLFNTVYASVITANCRIKLYQMAKRYEDDVISLATDSVLFEGRHKIETSKNLGEWDFEKRGRSVVLMNGVYEIGEKLASRGIMARTESGGSRGLNTPYGAFDNIFHYLRSRPERQEYEFFTDRPLQMGEAAKSVSKWHLDDVNTWQTFHKTFNINAEYKRLFEDTFKNGGELMTRSINSRPLLVEG